MSRELKVGLTVAVVEAILALIVGIILFYIQADTIEKETIETLSGYFDFVDTTLSYDQVLKSLYEDSQTKTAKIIELEQENHLLHTQLNDATDELSSEERNKAAILSAQGYADSDEYVNALALLNSVSSKTPYMENLIHDYTQKYEDKITREAEALVKADQHDEAADLVADALKVVPGSTLLEQKKIELENKRSKSFMSVLTPYEDSGYSAVVNGQSMEMGGSKYSDGFTLKGSYWDSAYAIFNLDGQYTKIKGVIGHIGKSGDSDTLFSIFADDALIDTIVIGWQQLPKEFSIDVTGVNQLKFERNVSTTVTGIAELMIS